MAEESDMSSVKHHGWAVGLAIGMLVGSAASCLGANAEHCAYGGGDLACGSEICVLALRGGTASGVGDDGCFDGAEAPGGFFHAEFGLPARLEAEGDAMDLASVEGLLLRLVDGERSVGASDLEVFRGDVFDDAARVRGLFTKEGGVREGTRDASAEDEQALEVYYAAVRAWLEGLPPGTETDTETQGTGDTEDATVTSTGDTSGPECTMDVECTDEALPFCGAGGECESCEAQPDPNAACADADAGLPLCVGGACVACTAEEPEACTGTTPLCDDASNTCVPCTAHEQCGEAACNLFTGACLPGDAVVHVGPLEEYTELGAAIASFAEGAEGTIIVHQANYDEAATVDGGRVLAFLANGGALPRWILAGGGSPQLTVTGAATVLMEGMQLSGNASDVGLRVDGGLAWVERGRVVDNNGGGIVAENGAELVLRNSFVGGNGSGGLGSFGIDVTDADVRVLYTTVARNDEDTIDSIRCMGATVDVRNSIVVGRDAGSIQCPGIVISNSAVDEAIDGNMNVGAAVLAWFVDGTAGNFHLTATGAMVFADIAQWQPGDPTTDIDGDPRPAMDGEPDFAGADVP